jgi:hypothetical protein
MKYTRILTLLLIFIFVSCESEKTKEDIIRKKIEEGILPNMNDPKSYEFVSIAIIDSSTYRENIDNKLMQLEAIRDYPLIIDLKKDMISLDEELYRLDKSHYKDLVEARQELEDIKTEQKNFEMLVKEVDSLKLTLENLDKTAVYLIEFKMRGNNSFGAKILNTYYFQVGISPDYEIYGYVDELDGFSQLNFNSIPWIFDLMMKHQLINE